MEKTRIISGTLIVLVAAAMLQSCLKEKYDISPPGGSDTSSLASLAAFDFKTVKKVSVTVSAYNSSDEPIAGVGMELCTSNPFKSNVTLNTAASLKKMFVGATNLNGVFKTTISIPTYVDTLYLVVNYIGLPTLSAIPVNSDQISCVLGWGKSGTKNVFSVANISAAVSKLKSASNGLLSYTTLGTWDRQGVPSYLMSPDDVITASLLAAMNATLPEHKSLPDLHPEYFTTGKNSNLVVKEPCEIALTFVHEGSAWTNAVGYYTYPTGNPPSSVSDLKDMTLIFPNASFRGFGGGLIPGNKVRLKYYDPVTKSYSNVFPANVTIGWFLMAQGWNSISYTVGNAYKVYFSDSKFNEEVDEWRKRQDILFYDRSRSRFMLGFEDIGRGENGCDNDFNDAVFNITASPANALNTIDVPDFSSPVDTDNDGVTDGSDSYPSDPDRAYNNYYPAKDAFGSLAFEDLWPAKGDYDFNDLVVDYNFNQITNGDNLVTGIDGLIVVRAIGGSYRNGFGFVLNTLAGNVLSVNGQSLKEGYILTEANGTEAGQSQAVILAFDNAYNCLKYPGTGSYINTYPGNPYVVPDTLRIRIIFRTPQDLATLGTPPYNPFIIINKKRGVEVHLPNTLPTDLADRALLGSSQDKSDPSKSNYYISDHYLPWAINIPERFDYPVEKQNILQVYLHLRDWANGLGSSYGDWYAGQPGYRNTSLIYKK